MSVTTNPNIIQTPAEAFLDLPGYPFPAQWRRITDRDLGELTMHYVDFGPRDGDTVLLLHGQPSWSYLYRKMIPLLADNGIRVIAPDLIGFGKSDKLVEASHQTYSRQVTWMHQFITDLELKDIHLFCQDWGGLIGLRVVAESPDLFASVVASNTALPTGDEEPSQAFLDWQVYVRATPDFDIGAILQRGSTSLLTRQEVDAYNAPFPSLTFRTAPNKFPMMVPTDPSSYEAQENRKAWEQLSLFDKPFVTAFGDNDPVSKGRERDFIGKIKGAANMNHKILKNGGHFIQEDCPEELVATILETIRE